MKPTNLVIAALLAATPAAADCGTIIQPPAPYDHPLAYDPTIHIMDYFAIDGFCRKLGVVARTDRRVEACNDPRTRTIYLPRVSPELSQCYFRHEVGHLEGWPGNHPGGTYQ